MKERKLILQGSPCNCDFYPEGPKTLSEAIDAGSSPCPHFSECENGCLDPVTGQQCLMSFGLQVAQFVIKNRTLVAKEVSDFRHSGFRPAKGFIWSPDRKTFTVITNFEEAVEKVREFAEMILGGPDGSKVIDERLRVGPSFDDVVAHAQTPEGAIDLRKMEELEGRFGTNGGVGCDVLHGPCSCGAWH